MGGEDSHSNRTDLRGSRQHRWRAQYGGVKADDAKPLKELELMTRGRSGSVAEQPLENQALKEVARGR